MRKELVISTFPQETRVAVLEDDELVEFLIERQRARSIAGNIYKGRVTKVLPGMQSAFVDIGLERDAFLYVTDFLEDTDEYERLVSSAEDEAFGEGASARRATRGRAPRADRPDRGEETRGRSREGEAPASAASKADDTTAGEEKPAAPAGPPAEGQRRTERRERKGRVGSFESRRDEAGSGRDEAGSRRDEAGSRRDAAASQESGYRGLEVLPGESLAKYKGTLEELEAKAEAESDPQVEQIIDETEEQHILEKYPREASMAIVDQEAPLEEDEEDGEADEGTEDAELFGSRAGSGSGASAEAASGAAESDSAAESDEAGSTTSEAGSKTSEAASPEPANPAAAADSDRPQAEEKTGDSGSGTEEPAAQESDAEEKPARRTWIWERRDKQRFSRRTPGRRPRRRSAPKSETPRPADSGGEPKISDLLHEGQEILVQVSKEPIGKKGARITSHIALPGRYLVYMPTVDHIGVSRKIASEEERSRLKKIIAENRNGFPGGFIVRTAAEGRDEKEFVQDLRFLFDLWKEIREKSDQKSGPSLIHSDLNLVEKVLRDQLSDEFQAIRLDNETEYANVLEFVSRFQPSLVNRVRLHVKDTSIFEEHGLQQEIDKAMRSKVWLKSGGYIVVNQTEALVAVDVNTGKFVGRSNRLEDTIVRTNMEAVHEIVRQIRLRNLGGIIVVDFIDMEERKSRHRVMQALEQELKKDRSPSKILQFNDFGLVAITRKRTQPSLEKVLGMTCPRCSGAGYVKGIETVCYEIQQEVKKMLAHIEGSELTVRVNPEVARALKKGDLVDFSELEQETRKDVRIQTDPALEAERFDIF